jgi:hypothetical protein
VEGKKKFRESQEKEHAQRLADAGFNRIVSVVPHPVKDLIKRLIVKEEEEPKSEVIEDDGFSKSVFGEDTLVAVSVSYPVIPNISDVPLHDDDDDDDDDDDGEVMKKRKESTGDNIATTKRRIPPSTTSTTPQKSQKKVKRPMKSGGNRRKSKSSGKGKNKGNKRASSKKGKKKHSRWLICNILVVFEYGSHSPLAQPTT